MTFLRTLIRIAAIVYICGTLFPPTWILVTERGAIGRSPATWFQAGDHGQYDGWLLTYVGTVGTILLWSQFVLVVAAILGSLYCRRTFAFASHLLLIGWAFLLAGNAWWVGLHSNWMPVIFAAMFASIGLVLVVGRTILWFISKPPPDQS